MRAVLGQAPCDMLVNLDDIIDSVHAPRDAGLVRHHGDREYLPG